MQFLRNILATVVAVSAAAFGVSADEAAAPGGTAEAAAKEAPQPAVKFTQAETDSIARAYATVMASYLAPQLAKDYQDNPDAAKEFVMGMRHAFDIRHEDSPYFAGVRHAMANFDRFDAMVGMGFPFTPQGYLYALEAALAGDTMGMDAKSADAYLHHIMERMYPAPKAPSAESQQAFLDAQAAREGVRLRGLSEYYLARPALCAPNTVVAGYSALKDADIPAVVAALGDPAAQGDGFSNIALAQISAIIGSSFLSHRFSHVIFLPLR